MTKSNFNSKKFVAYLLSLLIVAGILVFALFTQTFGWPMTTFMTLGILAISVMSIKYTVGQAALDKFIEMGKTLPEKMKNLND